MENENKIITGFTTDEGFRRIINEKGGSLNIDSVPEKLVTSLEALGGEASFNSTNETVLEIVNSEEPPVEYDVDFNELAGETSVANGTLEDLGAFYESMDADVVSSAIAAVSESGKETCTFTLAGTNSDDGSEIHITGTAENYDENSIVLNSGYGNYKVQIQADTETGDPYVKAIPMIEYDVDFNAIEGAGEERPTSIASGNPEDLTSFYESMNGDTFVSALQEMADGGQGYYTFIIDGTNSSTTLPLTVTGTALYVGETDLELDSEYGNFNINAEADPETGEVIVTATPVNENVGD